MRFGGIVDKGRHQSRCQKIGSLSKSYESNRFHFYSKNKFEGFPFVTGHLELLECEKIIEKCKSQKRFISNGKWSIVHFDNFSNHLLLIRDTLGICPLYYYENDKQIAFSDRIQFFKDLGTSWNLNLNATARFLLHGSTGKNAETLLNGIEELCPAESRHVNLSTGSKTSFNYYPKRPATPANTTYVNAVSYNRSQFVNHLKSNKTNEPQAVFLSGGLDSSCIAATFSQINGKQPNMITMSYAQKNLDESDWARLVVQKYNAFPWHIVTTTGSEFLQKVEEMHRIIEFPTLSTGTFNQYKLLQKCKELDIETAWDGLGADALYGGHDHYRHLLAMEYLVRLKIASAFQVLGHRNRPVNELFNSLKSKMHGFSYRSDFLRLLILRFTEDLKIFNRDFLAFALSTVESKQGNDNVPHRLKALMKKDYFEGGVQHLARFSDRLAYHFDVDLHYPYAENMQLASFISCMPVSYLLKGGRSKAILRDSFIDLLPQPIYNRQDKMGMVSPNNTWIEDHADEWIKYFEDDKDKIYNLEYLKNNYQRLWAVQNKRENYRIFKHISFAVWRHVFGL